MLRIELENSTMILYDLSEVSRNLLVSERTARQYIHDERLPAVKISGKWYVWERNLAAYLAGAKPRKRAVKPPQFQRQDFIE